MDARRDLDQRVRIDIGRRGHGIGHCVFLGCDCVSVAGFWVEGLKGRDLPAAGNAVRPEEDDQEHQEREHRVAKPAGRRNRRRPDGDADFRLAHQLREQRDDDRAGDRAGQAAHAADHQHGDDQEGEVEIEGLDPHRAEEMREQHAGDAGQEGADTKAISRCETMWTPTAAAATSSSREALSSSAERDSW